MRCVMNAPDLFDLETPLNELREAIACLHLIVEEIEHDSERVGVLHRIGNNMSKHVHDAYVWYEAHEAAKGNGPRAVS